MNADVLVTGVHEHVRKQSITAAYIKNADIVSE